jgi:hypothetical protein
VRGAAVHEQVAGAARADDVRSLAERVVRAARVVDLRSPEVAARRRAASDRRVSAPHASFAAAAARTSTHTAWLLEAAGSAVKPVWLTVECAACGERARIEAPIPDVRARVAAIELLLREGLGRPATTEEVPSPRLPASAAAVKEMDWDEMQALFAATYVEELAIAERSGGEAALRSRLASLSEAERQALRHALDELQPA